jgi:DNA-binding PucR family transcriptional regulator
MEENPFWGSGNLENLADNLRDMLHCPVTIEDVNHRLLSYSSHDSHTDPARINTIIQRRVPEKVINRLWQEGIILKLMQGEEPVRIEGIEDIGLGNRVAVSIRKNNEVIGYIWVVDEEARLSDEQLKLLKMAADSARSELLQIHARKKKKQEGYQDFLWQLLSGRFTTREAVEEKFRQLNLEIPASYAAVVFKFKEDISNKIEQRIGYIFKTNQHVSVSFFVVVQREIILIVSPYMNKQTLAEKEVSRFIHFFTEEMEEKFNAQNILGASGSVYEELNKAVKSYQEAQEVIRLIERFPSELKGVSSYPELGILRYLDVIFEKKSKEGYEHPAIEKLVKYDKQNKTNLLETLEVYINNDSNVNDAAKVLHVHMNTLNYRIKRIAAITDINLKNTNEKMSLYLDLKLKRLEESTRL